MPTPLQGTTAPTPANKAPGTNPRSLGKLKSVQSALLDVEVDARIIADGAGGSSGAKTTFTGGLTWSAPGYATDKAGKITSFDGKLTWHGTVTIQTLYSAGASASQVSCYGRGTTAADVRARDITLGFHENCHQDDFAAYLKAQALPDPPKMAIGMAASDYKAALAAFAEALKAYSTAMDQDSTTRTDEVGHARSVWLTSSKCFPHIVP